MEVERPVKRYDSIWKGRGASTEVERVRMHFGSTVHGLEVENGGGGEDKGSTEDYFRISYGDVLS